MARRALPFDPIAVAGEHWQDHGWEDAALGMTVLTSVMRVQQILAGRVERHLRPFGLTFARYEVLMLLSFSRRGTLPLGTMSQRLQVHPASVTNAVDRLERQGLVERRPHPRDRRAVLAVLTPDGRHLAAEATKAVNQEVFATLGLRAAEQRRLFALLRTVRRSEGDFVT